MARRKPYSKVVKENQIRAEHVDGMGDVVFLGFQCINPYCEEFIFVREDELDEDFEIECPNCKISINSGEETAFYDYKMVVEKDGEQEVYDEGSFTILHDEYIKEAQKYKYCIVCNTLKPLEYFDNHSRRKSGRQGECRLCKKIYNSIKNGTRLTDQHRESSQKRRLYLDLSGHQKINSKEIHKRFNFKCFKCGKDLSKETDSKERPLDHTLPAYYLWSLTTENATLLCRKHNGEKSGSWPSKFYSKEELKRLSVITGIDYDLMAGPPQYNPEAIEKLKDSAEVDNLLTKYGAYMDEIIKLRNRILIDIGFDFFENSTILSQRWKDTANKEYALKVAERKSDY